MAGAEGMEEALEETVITDQGMSQVEEEDLFPLADPEEGVEAVVISITIIIFHLLCSPVFLCKPCPNW